MYQDTIDAAGFAVWARVQAGEPLSMTLCHRVIGELGSTANAGKVYWLVRGWRAQINNTRRLSQR